MCGDAKPAQHAPPKIAQYSLDIGGVLCALVDEEAYDAISFFMAYLSLRSSPQFVQARAWLYRGCSSILRLRGGEANEIHAAQAQT